MPTGPLKERLQYAKAFAGVRALWIKFDPIGVFQMGTEWPEDEYDNYCGPVLSMLIHDASEHEIADYYKNQTEQTMGMNSTNEEAALFAEEAKYWWKNFLESFLNEQD